MAAEERERAQMKPPDQKLLVVTPSCSSFVVVSSVPRKLQKGHQMNPKEKVKENEMQMEME